MTTEEFGKIPHATEKDYERAFEGLKFPVAVHQVIRRAQDTGGIDREVSAMLKKLPRDQYASLKQLKADVRAVYAGEGFPDDKLPF